jgi:predicted N-acetyltransferase YhbS
MNEQIRQARPQELGELIALSDRTFRPEAGSTPMGTTFSHVLNESNIANVLVAVDGERIVSLIALYPVEMVLSGCRVPTFFMGSVCTDPAYRGQHLASRLLALAQQRIAEQSGAILFVSGEFNIYRRIDCMIVGELQEFVLANSAYGAAKAVSAVSEVGLWDGQDISGLGAAEEQEIVYFRRSEGELSTLIDNGSFLSVMGEEQHILVDKQNGVIQGYAVFGLSKDGTAGRIIELAGPDDAVERIIAFAFERFSVAEIRVTVPNYRYTLQAALTAAGHAFQSLDLPGTIKITDVPLLWNNLRPYLKERLGESGFVGLTFDRAANGFRIEAGGETWILDQRGMTRLVFNGPQHAASGPLKSLLSKVFPLPFGSPYNLNYV